MKIYLVGGAVDKLLNRSVKEHDYVVVSSTPISLFQWVISKLVMTFRFLHPETKDEYALATPSENQAKATLGLFAILRRA